MAPRLIAAILSLVLLNACATPRGVRLDTGQGAPLEYRPPASNKSLEVDEEAFEESLTQLALKMPLTVRSAQQGWLVRASYPSKDEDTRWQRLMSKSFGGLCEPGQRRETCLSLLDDVLGLSEWDKLGMGLALSLDPLKESIAKAVENTLAPQLFYTVIATGLIGWAAMAANPEPVFTKAAALISALLLIYLGVDTFLEVVDASRELKQATDSATLPKELELAGLRFANRVGPEVARVFVLAVTVVVSQGMTAGAALLASRLPLLPHFPEAAAVAASRFGLNLSNVGQVSAVAVVGNTIVVSLPATAVAMAAEGMGDAPPQGIPPPLRPEQGYLGSKKHGIDWSEGAATAKSTQTPQGQWGSISDLEFAGRKAAGLKPGKGAYFDLPEGHKSFVWRVDGTRVPAKRIWVRNNGTGTFHGYPLE